MTYPDKQNVDEVWNTSLGIAVEQALSSAENGMAPTQVIASVNIPFNKEEPSWDDAVYVLAYAWRRLPAVMMKGTVR